MLTATEENCQEDDSVEMELKTQEALDLNAQLPCMVLEVGGSTGATGNDTPIACALSKLGWCTHHLCDRRNGRGYVVAFLWPTILLPLDYNLIRQYVYVDKYT